MLLNGSKRTSVLGNCTEICRAGSILRNAFFWNMTRTPRFPNVGLSLTSDIASSARRTEISATTLRKS